VPTAEATVATTEASRYLVAVCRHASRVEHRILARHGHGSADRPQVTRVDWTDTDGTIELSWGRCRLHAAADELTVHLEADDDDRLGRIERIIERDLERYGRREDVAIHWRRPPTTSATARREG
jgi:hypothetical protein